MNTELSIFELSTLQKKKQSILEEKIDELLAESVNDFNTLASFIKKLKSHRKSNMGHDFSNEAFTHTFKAVANYSLAKSN
ncbi:MULTISPECIES: hypothetical protein [unclassified Pseudoalteromonas]|uniref:hypothetical protein n=1 Tax=unclassified Pseudoalteromonas TaxID=194690 RepID=UPI0011085990|nr:MULTISPECIES: hypothetical protein [unclassified Pseudoalteromonas]MCO7251349.1 hypothetical protein [Pseudoalteromonas sp. Ps84H-4]TMO43178.1 hypothetical protein CWC25_13310 [Pseudoalteromonas sp. S4389]